ncbi:hypothetical protein EV147_3898 [Cupriavidus agavae]|uniref:Uncharacterized protein n=1 Tax=Cupriavidus agavae TaxID=1001822 RepID=A0A4Q7RP56_9BURK|nr:hypothetical protein EV147_3898 [Cupriavidus agavae]
MKHEETSSRNPARKPTNSERQDPVPEVDAIPPSGSNDGEKEIGQTPNEIMNEQVSPHDEQGNREQSDKPNISG